MFRRLFGSEKINKIGFDDILYCIKRPCINFILINTLPIHEQTFLIKETVTFDQEERLINDSLLQYDMCTIFIYGKNSTDVTIEAKYHQLVNLGYPRHNLYIYYGGLFEWSLLQEIYGIDHFPTTTISKDILLFKSEPLQKQVFLSNTR